MDFRTFAITTARQAGDEILMRHHGKVKTLDWHTRTNFKTAVDDESDAFIRAEIEREFPDHRIHSEEAAAKRTPSPYRWIVDPLDGTLPYTTGINDHFSVSIALEEDGEVIVGVVYAPKRGELYAAECGKGTFLNGSRVTVALEDNLNHVIMGLDSGKEGPNFRRLELAGPYEKLLGPDGIAADLKHGCASVPLCLVACARLHAYAAMWLELEDAAAAVLINREAGTRVTTFSGEEWGLGDRSILAANPVLHAKLLERIR